MKNIITLSISVLLVQSLIGQQFNYSADLDSVKSNGYNKIELKPEITGKMQASFHDIRLFDSDNKVIPFILQSEKLSKSNNYFIDFPIIEKQFNSKNAWRSAYVFVNTNNDLIDHVVLSIKNFSSTKYARLSGKEGNQWFIIKDKIVLTVAENERADQEEVYINFPKSSYSMYKLEFTDLFGKDPININKIGQFKQQIIEGMYNTIPNVELHQLDSAKQSVVVVNLGKKQYINRLSFKVENAKQYHRRAEIQTKVFTNDSTYYYAVVSQFWLSSTRSNVLNLNNRYAQELRLVVYNKDDQPLVISEVIVQQLKHYLISNLSATNKYTLKFGNASATKANFDLQYFAKELPVDMPIINTKNISKITYDAEVKSNKWYESTLLLWGVLFVLGIGLVIVSAKLLKDLN